MRGIVISSDLDVYELARLIDPPVRNLLTVLAMEMNWDEQVHSSFRPVLDYPIAVVAHWWLGQWVTQRNMAFQGVKVLLWRNFQQDMYLQVVT